MEIMARISKAKRKSVISILKRLNGQVSAYLLSAEESSDHDFVAGMGGMCESMKVSIGSIYDLLPHGNETKTVRVKFYVATDVRGSEVEETVDVEVPISAGEEECNAIIDEEYGEWLGTVMDMSCKKMDES